jgi:hypothetical protein
MAAYALLLLYNFFTRNTTPYQAIGGNMKVLYTVLAPGRLFVAVQRWPGLRSVLGAGHCKEDKSGRRAAMPMPLTRATRGCAPVQDHADFGR